MPPLSVEPVAGCPGAAGQHLFHLATRADVTCKSMYFFSRDKIPIDVKMLVFFVGKCVRTAAKKQGYGQKKKTEGTNSGIFGVGTAVNSSIVPTEFAAEPTTKMSKMKSSKANSKLNFSPSTKRQLSILLNFFCVYCLC